MQEAQFRGSEHRLRAQRSEAGHGLALPALVPAASLNVPNGFAPKELIECVEFGNDERLLLPMANITIASSLQYEDGHK